MTNEDGTGHSGNGTGHSGNGAGHSGNGAGHSGAEHRINYTAIWIGLMVLMAISVAVDFIHVPAWPAAVVIFSVAAWKAILVARNYMHMRSEGALVASLVIVPILLLLILVLLLMPDISFSDRGTGDSGNGAGHSGNGAGHSGNVSTPEGK